MCTYGVPISFVGNFLDFFECLRAKFLEAHSMDMLVNVDGIFLGHHFIDGRMALLLLATLLCGSHSAGPKLERKGLRDCGKESPVAFNFWTKGWGWGVELFITLKKRIEKKSSGLILTQAEVIHSSQGSLRFPARRLLS